MKLPIGTKVYLPNIEGEVKNHVHDNDYPLLCEFENGVVDTYSVKGQFRTNWGFATLSLTPYTLEQGGFTPITEFGKPKKGDWGWFWDSSLAFQERADFGQLQDVVPNARVPYVLKNCASYENFSPNPPEHIKQFLKCK